MFLYPMYILTFRKGPDGVEDKQPTEVPLPSSTSGLLLCRSGFIIKAEFLKVISLSGSSIQ